MNNPPTTNQEERLAIFGDVENVLLPVYLNPLNYPEKMKQFLKELLDEVKRAHLVPAPGFCHLYMEQQGGCTQEWHGECFEAARQYGFNLHWSPLRRPAESLLERHILRLLHSQREHMLPRHIILISGDDDTIPSIDALRWTKRRRDVCVMSWKRVLNKWIKAVASGIIELDAIAPRTQHLVPLT